MIDPQKSYNEGIDLIRIGMASPEAIEASHTRLFVVMSIFIISFCVLSLRIFDVAVLSGNSKANFANTESYGEVFIKNRADIVDRNGVLLAINLSTASLYANPKIISDTQQVAQKLVTVFPNMDRKKIAQKLSANKSFVWIKRNLTPQEKYLVNSLGIPGLRFKEEEKRVYPHKGLFAHVLGAVDIDGKGVSGIEKQLDNYLSGKDETGLTNDSLKLSLDMRVQNVAHQVLKKAMNEFSALGASGIVMDVNTGEVISMISLPDYNLNYPGKSARKAKFNRSTLGVYEMGSTFKTFNMALGFELGDIGMEDEYDVSKPLKVANFTIRDYHAKKGRLSVPEIFMYSSNIGSAKIAVDIGAQDQRSFLSRLGLLDGLEIELPEKAYPLYPQKWGKVSAMTISYGHGIAVTPMHMVQATSALVNGGVLHPATLLHKKIDSDIKGERVISENSSNNIRKLMRLAVKYGTGSNAEIDGYLVGGKTGSADKVNKGKYDRKTNISSFVAAFPMNKPKYVVFVMLDEPKGNASTRWYATGGMVAAPAVKEIITRIAPIVGVMPVDESDYEIRREFWYDNDKNGQKLALAKSL